MRPTANSQFTIHNSQFVWLLSLMLAVGLPGTASAQEAPQPVPKAAGSFLGYKAAIQIGLAQHPLVKKSQESAQAADAVMQQAKATYYPQIDAYAIQTGGNVRPLSAFNVAGAQNKPTSYIQNAGMMANQLI